MLKIEWIYECILRNQYYFSRHADQERQNDNLTIIEVEEAIMNGRILQQYGDEGRGISCLMAGLTDGGKAIHIVCGERKDRLVLITVYIPSPPKFKSPFERG